MDFKVFKAAVAAQFAIMAKHELYRTAAEPDNVWALYLSSFPAGTNPMYRERTEHDCSCCKQFIRNIGNVVAIIDGKKVSIWDGAVKDQTYQHVAGALAAYVKSFDIADLYRHYENAVGTDKNFEQIADDKQTTWHHFHVNLPAGIQLKKDAIATFLGTARSGCEVMARGLNELPMSAVDTVLELIAQNSLYRGAEFKHAVEEFRKLMVQYDATSDKDLFIWANHKAAQTIGRIRNTAIGTLLVDLAKDVDLEAAVKKFEAVVAPANYKRPVALVTKKMLDDAKATVESLGLTSALERRFATLSDISVNNILFADRTAKQAMTGSAFDDVAPTVTTKVTAKVEDVPIDKFVTDILPKITSMEVMMENRHASNLVSLIAPIDPTAGSLFKWDNKFSWSYNGEMADSIKEKVKAAGGKVDGDLCCRLAWFNSDDLDFHMVEPNGDHIYFGCRGRRSTNGGMLDVDANGADGIRENPVENIVYPDKSRMKLGKYELTVKQFRQRNTSVDTQGFEVEIEIDGKPYQFAFPKMVKQSQSIHIATLTRTKDGITFVSHLPPANASKDVWGVKTHDFCPVSVMMASPNHWDGHGVGNKHWFFMLHGAKQDGKVRGFYNEFLKPDLEKHRRVFELLGGKIAIADDQNQLSGLGFSTTQRNNLLCRVKGSFTRTINIIF